MMHTTMKHPARTCILVGTAALLAVLVLCAVLFFGRSAYLSPYIQTPFVDKTAQIEAREDFTNPYSDQTPLHEADLQNLKHLWNYIKPAELLSESDHRPENAYAILPFDLHYYTAKNDRKPAFTLKKGEKVNLGINFDAGYGMILWPDYDAAWRYGIPFQTSDFDFNELAFVESAYYYVKTDDLIRLYGHLYNEMRADSAELKNMRFTTPEYKAYLCSTVVYTIDNLLYMNGLFDSPALHNELVLWW